MATRYRVINRRQTAIELLKIIREEAKKQKRKKKYKEIEKKLE